MHNPVFAQRMRQMCVHSGFPTRAQMKNHSDVIRWTTLGCPRKRERSPTGRPQGCAGNPSVFSCFLQSLDEVGDLIVNLLAFLHQPLDLVDRVDDCRVVTPTEQTSDVRVP